MTHIKTTAALRNAVLLLAMILTLDYQGQANASKLFNIDPQSHAVDNN